MLGNTVILNWHWISIYLIAIGLYFWGKCGAPNTDQKNPSLHHQWATSSFVENYTFINAFRHSDSLFFFFVAYWLFPSQDTISNVFPLSRNKYSCRITRVNFEFEPPFWKIKDGVFNIVMQYWISSKCCSMCQQLLWLYPDVIRMTAVSSR